MCGIPPIHSHFANKKIVDCIIFYHGAHLAMKTSCAGDAPGGLPDRESIPFDPVDACLPAIIFPRRLLYCAQNEKHFKALQKSSPQTEPYGHAAVTPQKPRAEA
jgi:hypothetical protein